jgi:hypothetical protein
VSATTTDPLASPPAPSAAGSETLEARHDADAQRIRLEAALERRSLCVFGMALTYAARGQMHINLA